MNFSHFSLTDVAFTKAAVFFATLFLVSVWSGFTEWVVSIHWGWFLVIALGCSVKPCLTVFKK